MQWCWRTSRCKTSSTLRTRCVRPWANPRPRMSHITLPQALSQRVEELMSARMTDLGVHHFTERVSTLMRSTHLRDELKLALAEEAAENGLVKRPDC